MHDDDGDARRGFPEVKSCVARMKHNTAIGDQCPRSCEWYGTRISRHQRRVEALPPPESDAALFLRSAGVGPARVPAGGLAPDSNAPDVTPGAASIAGGTNLTAWPSFTPDGASVVYQSQIVNSNWRLYDCTPAE